MPVRDAPLTHCIRHCAASASPYISWSCCCARLGDDVSKSLVEFFLSLKQWLRMLLEHLVFLHTRNRNSALLHRRTASDCMAPAARPTWRALAPAVVYNRTQQIPRSRGVSTSTTLLQCRRAVTHWIHNMKTYRHLRNRKYITFGKDRASAEGSVQKSMANFGCVISEKSWQSDKQREWQTDSHASHTTFGRQNNNIRISNAFVAENSSEFLLFDTTLVDHSSKTWCSNSVS